MKKAAFIDRDGTLVEEVNYLSRVEDLRIFDYTREALELLRLADFHIVVVTNQSGIGRGIYTEQAMHSIHKAMDKELGGLIDSFYFCPHLPDAGCECRKPGMGMIKAACMDHQIEMSGSWMIGDKLLDIQTGFNAGIGTAMVQTGYGKNHADLLDRDPDIIGADLLAVVQNIIDFSKGSSS